MTPLIVTVRCTKEGSRHGKTNHGNSHTGTSAGRAGLEEVQAVVGAPASVAHTHREWAEGKGVGG